MTSMLNADHSANLTGRDFILVILLLVLILATIMGSVGNKDRWVISD